ELRIWNWEFKLGKESSYSAKIFGVILCEEEEEATPRIKYRFCAQKIVSVSNRAGCLCTISMLWQEDPVTGPWIAEKA
ncbi:hypothetical protein H0E87_007666, partial [Populus deltoides]